MDVDDEEDPVPEITKRHFEEAMKFARRYQPHPPCVPVYRPTFLFFRCIPVLTLYFQHYELRVGMGTQTCYIVGLNVVT